MLKVMDGISHTDHGLTEAQLAYLLAKFVDKTRFFIETVELPDALGTVKCGLYGPVMGDEPVTEDKVKYVVRGERKCASRVVNAPARMTHKVTVVAGPHGEDSCVLYTAYGGPPGSREPGDTSIPTMEAIEEARAFWSEHALAAEG